MAEKEYVCAYGKKCLHGGSKVKASESVVLNKRHYHWDCAARKQEILECANAYIECVDDKSQFPAAVRVIGVLIGKNQIPAEYILDNIKRSSLYYKDKPVFALYGLRKLFWERDFKG